MITIVLLLKRKQGMTKEQFRDYYENVHVPLGRTYLGHLFLDYRRNYVNSSIAVEGDGMAAQTEDAYDAVTCIFVKDEAALEEFWRIASDPQIGRILSEDEARFLERRDMKVFMCDEVKTWVASDL